MLRLLLTTALLQLIIIFIPAVADAQTQPVDMAYTVSMDTPSNHLFHVQLRAGNIKTKSLVLNMCAWTPGFYEIMDYSQQLSHFRAYDGKGKVLPWSKTGENSWQIQTNKNNSIEVSYDIKAVNPFIGSLNLDSNYGYIIPGGLLLYENQSLKHPVTVQVKPFSGWPQMVATGLNTRPGKPNTFYANDFDELYDSPILAGQLESLPAFQNAGKEVQFIGHRLGSFNRQQFMDDLKKIVVAGSAVIGDVPYNHYSFLAVGMNGSIFAGIEHLNSASLMISNADLLANESVKINFYSFLAHEYFHTYNVKRIRPVALGPFDYSKENYTNLLWLSEGVTNYYENLILNRAGFMTREQVLDAYSEQIGNYENSTGHFYQSANQASQGIWAQRGRPTERTPEEVAKTISVYDKGCALGLLLDLAIRHETKNKKSLDDLMRFLYQHYFISVKRGFTDTEFQLACEAIAGIPLTEFFSYASTVNAVNYPKYLAYAGLQIDTLSKPMQQLYTGADIRLNRRDSSLVIRNVEWQSSAYNAGLEKGDQLVSINGRKADAQAKDAVMQQAKPGDEMELQIKRGNMLKNVKVVFSVHYTKSFKMTPLPNPDALQSIILNSWLKQ